MDPIIASDQRLARNQADLKHQAILVNSKIFRISGFFIDSNLVVLKVSSGKVQNLGWMYSK